MALTLLQIERDRLDLNHELYRIEMGGKFFLSPLEKLRPQRILDVGTGTGIWATEMADL